MWRRLLASQFKTLATVPCRSASKTPPPLRFKSHISPSPSVSFLTRCFSSGSGKYNFRRSSSMSHFGFKLYIPYDLDFLHPALISIGLECVADNTVKKRVEDVMPIATGHEREELEAELEGKKILEDVNNPVGPFGTKLEVVGPGGPPDGHGDDDHH
ncbi:hypothetical protein V6N13_063217 [Hibiscus sabdariffa]